MKSLIVAIVLALTLLGLTGVPACVGRMESGKEMMVEKDVMSTGRSMTEPSLADSKDTSVAVMEKGQRGNMIRIAKLQGSESHHATGTVVLTTDRNGIATLQFKDMTVDKVPDGRVYLARNGDYRNGVELGKLTQFSGTVTLPIPAGINGEDFDSVVIWCKKFNVVIGRGSFEKRTM
ncbi:MAG: DM13 domain-containing protein [Nitrospirota bacterium]